MYEHVFALGTCSMIVQRVVMPVTESVSWTVLGDDGAPVEPVESYLSYLAALERSPNTQRAYATSLKLWFEFLDRTSVAWQRGAASTMSPSSWRGFAHRPTNVIVLGRGELRARRRRR